MKTKTMILGLAAVAIAAVGVYALTQTLGSRDASVAASKTGDKNGISSKVKKDDDGKPASKYSSKGPSTPGLGF